MINIREHSVPRAYCLYIYHRFKLSGDLSHSGMSERQISQEINEREKFRSELHEEAIKYLVTLGLDEKSAKKLLQLQIDELIKEKLPSLEKDECYCGLCRIKIKSSDFAEHSKTDRTHNLIDIHVMLLAPSVNVLRAAVSKYLKHLEVDKK